MQQTIEFDLLKVGHCSHPECIVMRGGRWNPIEFPALAGLLRHPTAGLILYDTGYSPKFMDATRRFPECLYRLITPPSLPPAEELLSQLEERNIRAEDIGTIVISHFHADHVAGLHDFPSARFLATRDEYQEVRRKGRIGRLRCAYLQDLLPRDFDDRVTYADDCDPAAVGLRGFATGYDLLGDGSLLGVPLPGHARSQLGLLLTDQGGIRRFLIGDACWKIEALERRSVPSAIAMRLFADRRVYRETFAKLADLAAADPSLSIIPSHCLTMWNRLGNTRHVAND